MIRYAHIGYAKSASSYLQSYYFPQHPEIAHFGRAHGDQIPSDDLRIFLWSELIETPDFLFDDAWAQDLFSFLFKHVSQASDKRACGISHELITNLIQGRQDLTARARRLRSALGPDTRILIIVRNQLDWIRSLYTGLLQEGGLTFTFDEFLFYFYYDKDRSPFASLFYDKVFELYADLFGYDNLYVIPFERLKHSPQKFADDISTALSVSSITPKQNAVNTSPSGKELSALLEANKQYRYNLGGSPLERPWGMSAKPVYDRAGVNVPLWTRKGAQKYHTLWSSLGKIVEQLENQGMVLTPMTLEMPEHYRNVFTEAYAPHNRRLVEQTGLELETLSYPV